MTITIPLPTYLRTYPHARLVHFVWYQKGRVRTWQQHQQLDLYKWISVAQFPFIVWDWRRKAIKVFSFQLKLDSAEIDPNENIHRQTGIFVCKPSYSYCWHAFLHIILFKSISFNRNTTFMASTTHHPGKAVIFSNWDCIDSDFFLAGGWKSQDIWAITGGEVRIGQTYFCIWNIFPPQPAPQIFVQFQMSLI